MKVIPHLVFAVAALITNGTAYGEGRQFYECTLAEGRTFEDLHGWATDWRVAADAAGLQDYRNTILIPVGNKDAAPGSYMWEAAAPSANEFAAVDKWFAESEVAKALQARFVRIATCGFPTSWKVSRAADK